MTEFLAGDQAYEEAISYIHSLHRFGVRPGLERITELLGRLGNPHRDLKVAHVTGTNGKGSATAMIASVLQAAGLRTGLYISPYLEEFTERIRVNGLNIPKGDLVNLLREVRQALSAMTAEGLEHPTEFEVVTAIGFLHYARQRVDALALEVGLGGRYDATNVVGRPLVSVITNVGLDHMNVLGNTVEEIAREKAGICKPGIPCVTATNRPGALAEIERVCRDVGAPLTVVGREVTFRVLEAGPAGLRVEVRSRNGVYPDLEIGLAGSHQAENAATALAACEELVKGGLPVDEEAIRRGLRTVRWPGRLELFPGSPPVLIDGAHNADGAEVLANSLRTLYRYRRLILVVGILADKEVERVLGTLVPLANLVVSTTPDNPRAVPPADLAHRIELLGRPCLPVPDPADALDAALAEASPEDLVCVAGSLYLVGRVRTLLRNRGADR